MAPAWTRSRWKSAWTGNPEQRLVHDAAACSDPRHRARPCGTIAGIKFGARSRFGKAHGPRPHYAPDDSAARDAAHGHDVRRDLLLLEAVAKHLFSERGRIEAHRVSADRRHSVDGRDRRGLDQGDREIRLSRLRARGGGTTVRAPRPDRA